MFWIYCISFLQPCCYCIVANCVYSCNINLKSCISELRVFYDSAGTAEQGGSSGCGESRGRGGRGGGGRRALTNGGRGEGGEGKGGGRGGKELTELEVAVDKTRRMISVLTDKHSKLSTESHKVKNKPRAQSVYKAAQDAMKKLVEKRDKLQDLSFCQ